MPSAVQTLSQYLTRRLSGDSVVVAFPDHPHLLASPDILVGGRGRLAALFVIRQNTSFGHLRARLIAARLALPSHTRLLAYSVRQRAVPHDLENSFDEIVSPRRRNLLVGAASAGGGANPRDADIREISRRHDLRFATILRLISLRSKRKPRAHRPIALIRALRNGVRSELASLPNPAGGSDPKELTSDSVVQVLRRAIPSRRISILHGSVVTSLPGRTRDYIRTRLHTIWQSGFVGAYALDNGVPYPKDLLPHVVLAERGVAAAGDPLKPIRVAAFAGWALTTAERAEDVERFVDRLQRSYRKRLNEWS